MEHAVATPLAGTVTHVAVKRGPAGAARGPAGGGIGLRWPTDDPPPRFASTRSARATGCRPRRPSSPTDAKLALHRHAGRRRPARDRDHLARLPEGDPAAGRCRRAAARGSSGGPASATRSWSRTQRGLERAIAAEVDAICLITAATDSYVQHNIGMSIDESLAAFEPIAAEARQRGWWIRGYVSTAFGCPYEGEVDERAVVGVAERLLRLGVDELSISDTLGVAAPVDVTRVLGGAARRRHRRRRARAAPPRHARARRSPT